MSKTSLSKEYLQLKTDSGVVPLPGHSVIRLTGGDRLTFLHNFCTADTKKLPAGQGTEAFILNEKGKCLAFVNLLALEDEMLMSFHGGSPEEIIAHLDKYLIREDVEISDVSDRKNVWFVGGPQTESELAADFGTATDQKVTRSPIESLVVAGAEVAGLGYLLIADSESKLAVENWLGSLEIPVCDPGAMHAIRVLNVTPWNGLEVTVDNLPQEVDRDAKAISFDKGCYLGQETVARLDAIGRVNWLLRGFIAPEGHQPKGGDNIQVDGKPVGRITSVGFNPDKNRWMAIGYAKRGFEKTGCEMDGWVVR